MFGCSLMLSSYTAINQNIVLSPVCVPEKVDVNEKIKNDFSIKKGEGGE